MSRSKGFTVESFVKHDRTTKPKPESLEEVFQGLSIEGKEFQWEPGIS